MATQTAGKHPKLAKAEHDFEQLKKLFNQEPKVKETKPLKNIMNCMNMYLRNKKYAERLLNSEYRLQYDVYPEGEIIPRVAKMMRDLIPLYKLYRSRNLFNS